ncbi:MAG: SDR family oxidoreductase [Cyclobacteriaceae bacterium]|nr:SDR family oxidoreductase [Cyclobacteriaceae bacterium]
MFNLSGKSAIVTGAAKGIGKAISLKLAAHGAHVTLLDMDETGLNETFQEIKKAGNCDQAICDITSREEVEKIFEKVSTANGLHILINNAGIAHVGNVEDTSEEDFDKVYNINVKGTFHCLQAGVKAMKKSGGGCIVNLASIAALVGLSDRFAYTASKGAILSMTYSIAKDYLNDKIRCNSISPGRVHTPFVDGFLAKNYKGKEQEIFEKLSKSQPIGRMGKPEEIANLALFLCSDEAAFITGSNYVIDGGLVTLNT